LHILKIFFFCIQTSGDTILHLAAQKKDIELAKLVYEHGASVNAQNVRTILSNAGTILRLLY